MTSSMPRTLAMVLAAGTLVACHPGAKVSSPSPSSAPAPAASRAPAAMATPAAVTPAAIAEGKTLFEGAPCARCHGANAQGGQRGPNLADTTWAQIDGSFDAIVRIIKSGVPQASIKGGYQFAMRPLGGATFTDAQVTSVAAYIYSLSHK